jgi:hypothetical protein
MAAAAPRARLTFLPAIEAQPIVTEGWALPNSIQHLTVELPVGRTEGGHRPRRLGFTLVTNATGCHVAEVSGGDA